MYLCNHETVFIITKFYVLFSFVYLCAVWLFVCLHLFVCFYGYGFLFSFSSFKLFRIHTKNVFFSLQVMPFSLTQGGKCAAHVLQKHKPKRALVFVRARGELLQIRRKDMKF